MHIIPQLFCNFVADFGISLIMKRIITILLIWTTALGTALADNKQAEQMLEQADKAYAEQDYKQALECALKALPVCRGTESEADSPNALLIAIVSNLSFSVVLVPCALM